MLDSTYDCNGTSSKTNFKINNYLRSRFADNHLNDLIKVDLPNNLELLKSSLKLKNVHIKSNLNKNLHLYYVLKKVVKILFWATESLVSSV